MNKSHHVPEHSLTGIFDSKPTEFRLHRSVCEPSL